MEEEAAAIIDSNNIDIPDSKKEATPIDEKNSSRSSNQTKSVPEHAPEPEISVTITEDSAQVHIPVTQCSNSSNHIDIHS